MSECHLCGLQVIEEGQLYDDGSFLACGDGHLSIVWCDEDSGIAAIYSSLDMAEALERFGERVSNSPMDRFDRADLKEMIKAAQALTRHAEFGLRTRNACDRLDKHGDPHTFVQEVVQAMKDTDELLGAASEGLSMVQEGGSDG